MIINLIQLLGFTISRILRKDRDISKTQRGQKESKTRKGGKRKQLRSIDHDHSNKTMKERIGSEMVNEKKTNDN